MQKPDEKGLRNFESLAIDQMGERFRDREDASSVLKKVAKKQFSIPFRNSIFKSIQAFVEKL